jgi:hypothetical protein
VRNLLGWKVTRPAGQATLIEKPVRLAFLPCPSEGRGSGGLGCGLVSALSNGSAPVVDRPDPTCSRRHEVYVLIVKI